MTTLHEVQEQIKALGGTEAFGTKKEIKYLPEILGDEKILGLTSGLMDGNTWLIVCTDKRVIFIDKGMIYGLKQLETPLEKINSIEQKTGLIFGKIGIWDGSSKMEIKQVSKTTIKPFVEAVNKAREGLKVAPPQAARESSADELVKLAGLVEKGLLSTEEFQAAKDRLLY